MGSHETDTAVIVTNINVDKGRNEKIKTTDQQNQA